MTSEPQLQILYHLESGGRREGYPRSRGASSLRVRFTPARRGKGPFPEVPPFHMPGKYTGRYVTSTDGNVCVTVTEYGFQTYLSMAYKMDECPTILNMIINQ